MVYDDRNPIEMDDLGFGGSPNFRKLPYGDGVNRCGDGSKPCTPVVHIKITGLAGCSSF